MSRALFFYLQQTISIILNRGWHHFVTLTGIYGFHRSLEINMQNMVRQQKENLVGISIIYRNTALA